MIQATANRVEKLWIIVLAAGGSSRLGRPKQLLRSAGRTLLARAIAHGAEISAGRVVTVIGADAHRMRAHVRRNAPTTRCVYNADWRSGMGSSLALGIRAVPRSATAVMVLLCDQPKITAQHLRRLTRRHLRHNANTIVASRYRDRCGVPAIFPRRAFSALRALRGDHGARALLNSADSGFPVAAVDLPEAACDVDTPADAADLLA